MNRIPQSFEIAFESIKLTGLKELQASLFRKAMRYCMIRNEWMFLSSDEKVERDQERSTCHNSFIDALNILSRNMAIKGENSSWRNKLGDERKTLGDFACYVVFRNGTAMR